MADILDRFESDDHSEKTVTGGPKLRVGIIGCGWIAEAHILGYKKLPNVEIVAACDLIPGKAEALFE